MTAAPPRAHLVVVDASANAAGLCRAAKGIGCAVTLVISRANRYLISDDALSQQVLPHADAVHEIDDPRDEAGLEAALAAIDRDRPVDGLATVVETAVAPLAAVARRLGLRFTGPEAVRAARDKALWRERLADSGPRLPRQATAAGPEDVPRAAAAFDYPLVVKPARGTASLGARIVGSAAELPTAVAALTHHLDALPAPMRSAIGSDLVVQEYLQGPLVSLDASVRGGRVEPFGVVERRRAAESPTLELGAVTPTGLDAVTAAAVTDCGSRAIEGLGLDLGVFHVEMIVTADGPVLIDVNPRLIGGPGPLLIGHTWDVDVLATLAAVHAGLPPPPRAARPVAHAAAHVLAARRDADWPAAAGTPDAWLRDLPHVRAWRVRAQGRVARARGNFDYAGWVLAVAPDAATASDACRRAIDVVAERTGIPFHRWPPDRGRDPGRAAVSEPPRPAGRGERPGRTERPERPERSRQRAGDAR